MLIHNGYNICRYKRTPYTYRQNMLYISRVTANATIEIITKTRATMKNVLVDKGEPTLAAEIFTTKEILHKPSTAGYIH